jgi:hypothetical protein
MRTTLIVLASIGSLIASSAAFAAAPYASTAAPAVVKHQIVKKVSGTSYASGVKHMKPVHKAAGHKHHKKTAKHAAMKAM